MKNFFLLVFLLLGSASNTLAVDDSLSVLDQITPAWQRLDTLPQSYLTEEQLQKVQQLAFAVAVSDIRQGLDIKWGKFASAFEYFNGEKQWKDKLLVAYGFATGLFAAEGMLVQDRFCSSAETIRATSTDHYWLAAGEE